MSAPTSGQPGRPRQLGAVLVQMGALSPEDVALALQAQREGPTRMRLGEVMLQLGMIDEALLARALAASRGLPFIELSDQPLDPATARLLPRDIAEHYRLVPFHSQDGALHVAVADPVDVVALDDLRTRLRHRSIQIHVARRSAIDDWIREAWQGTENREAVRHFEGEMAERASRNRVPATDQARTADGGAVRVVRQLIDHGLDLDASDIHVQPESDRILVRYRVDGILQDGPALPLSGQSTIATRLKILSGMVITERRLPQDGRMQHSYRGAVRQIRVSSIPGIKGEKFVLRVLGDAGRLPSVEDLGMPEDQFRAYLRALRAPQGTILITGPTGSGKTTTLYSGLAQVLDGRRNILTLEDPVEIEMDGITQIAIREDIGMTFSRGLRAALRQDPDVLLVGEIRDRETAELAMRAALTGHVVLSTLHTLNAPSAISRLIDIGIPNYIASSAISMVIAQRLVRRICPWCITADRLDPATAADLGVAEQDRDTFVTGAGCDHCHHTGHSGRIAAYEVMPMSAPMRAAVLDDITGDELAVIARREGWRPLREAAMDLARQGLTSVQEVIRVTQSAIDQDDPLPPQPAAPPAESVSPPPSEVD